ncbi:MAG: hypothetical protein QMD85_04885 [Candidatus Aenigmarchaeota archaeon]|nr:hypothetical protein [Candidatus Aenigmarchaeota archaeon]MDI6722898.1 hypothetical protein [Candidatus Aenigmarchaeota archaeon]
MQRIKGIVTALFTPMFSDGKIDWKNLEMPQTARHSGLSRDSSDHLQASGTG